MARSSTSSLTALLIVIFTTTATADPGPKQASALFPASLLARARNNIARYEWAQAAAASITQAARPWLDKSDDELWALMFGPRIKRSWMVWSNGYCPACKKSVPMYTWEMDAMARPWKTRCPHCHELFPKNDFQAFYRSGLDAHGVFDPARADRSLLFNAEHPAAGDPLHSFGVDDGEGYVDGDHRWRFIGAYLIFGQWKQAIVAGIQDLAAAYVVSGDARYAHKAGVLLDRVADLYPTFDFGKEGVMYEGPPRDGYVSTWHDACVEVRTLAIAYDQIFEALRGDDALIKFLAEKAKRYGIENAKQSFPDVQRNIEQRILLDTIQHRPKIESNYPQTDISLILCQTVLAWPANRTEIMALIDAILEKSTAVDGLTGEKGLSGYTILAPEYLAVFLGQFMRADENFLRQILTKRPRLRDMYRFPIDTWCLQKYYPQSGDCGGFARTCERYLGVVFSKTTSIEPSPAEFLWQLFEETHDPAFVKVLHHANDDSVEGLPYDLFANDPPAFQQHVREVIARDGSSLDLASVNKQQWHLAILRSGRGRDARAAWLDYDSGGNHSHHDAMNLGLFAKGLDLMPDFGYPPVQFGGWTSPRSLWYMMTAAHNTVMVDGKDTVSGAGETTLWADGKQFHAVRASAPACIGGQRYERTVIMVDISDNDFYLVDIFRVAGGKDHVKFMRSHFGTITSKDLSLTPSDPPPSVKSAMQMRSFQKDSSRPQAWSVDWKIDDRYRLLPQPVDLHLKYCDLTSSTHAYTAESWVVGEEGSVGETWIPTVLVHRHSDQGPLSSTFVSAIEPYEASSNIRAVRRFAPQPPIAQAGDETRVILDIELTTGSHDLFVSNDPNTHGAAIVAQRDLNVELDGDLCWLRYDSERRLQRAALCHSTRLRTGEYDIELMPATDFVEFAVTDDHAWAIAGDNGRVIKVLHAGRSIWDPTRH